MINKIKKSIKTAKGKSGFSLVELIISFAILATVALCVGIMMTSGTNVFVRVNNRISLSYAQQAMIQIEEYFDDCNGICMEDGKTYLTTLTADGQLYLYSLEFDEEASTLYLNKQQIVNGTAGTVETQPISTKITAFNVNYLRTSAERLTGVSIELTATVSNTPYTKNKLVTFRSAPICVTEAENGSLSENLVSQVWEAIEE